jgi:putative FmdB family regulatory protein
MVGLFAGIILIMPSYSYFCDKCKIKFEIFCSIKDYKENIECSECNSAKHTRRAYIEDISSLYTSIKKSDNELSTIGDIANRNRDKMSDDQRIELSNKHNDYKETQSNKELPTGMSRLKKSKTKIKWT